MELGTIVSQQVGVQDLQAQVDAMSDRIATLTAEIARIQRQLANPNLPLETRSRLSARLAADRRELRELRDGRAQTTREGQLATVSLSLTTEKRASAAPASSRFDRALDQAAEVLAFEASALVLLLVAVGPLVLLGLLVWLGVRVTRRRADDRLLERA
jgi:TolA-binding protein